MSTAQCWHSKLVFLKESIPNSMLIMPMSDWRFQSCYDRPVTATLCISCWYSTCNTCKIWHTHHLYMYRLNWRFKQDLVLQLFGEGCHFDHLKCSTHNLHVRWIIAFSVPTSMERFKEVWRNFLFRLWHRKFINNMGRQKKMYASLPFVLPSFLPSFLHPFFVPPSGFIHPHLLCLGLNDLCIFISVCI